MRYIIPLALIAIIVGAFFITVRRFAYGETLDTKPATLPAVQGNQQKAIFSAGCFWGVQDAFARLPGVVSATAGYTGGKIANPTYEDVCSDHTGHAESVQVIYDPTKISYAELLDTFWSIHDPTTKDSQGPDFGNQYRSAIFYFDAEQQKIAQASIKEVTDAHIFHDPIVTELLPAQTFYTAEEYHQMYFVKLGGGQTCHNSVAIVHTKLAAAAAKERQATAAAH